MPKKKPAPKKKPGKATSDSSEEVKLVVFGSGGVGKSALIVQLIQNVFVEQYDPTLEDSYRKDTKLDDKKLVLDILDTAGQEEFHTLRDQYIRQGEGYIIVYSITNRPSFDEVEQFLDQIIQSTVDAEEVSPTLASQIPIVVVGNKCDLEDLRKISKEDLAALSEKYGKISTYETSAKTRKNVEECFIDCAKQVIVKVKSNKKKKKDCIMM